MNNDEIIFNIRERRKKLVLLEAAQNNQDARELVIAERFYVDTLLEYREKHGGIAGIVTEIK